MDLFYGEFFFTKSTMGFNTIFQHDLGKYLSKSKFIWGCSCWLIPPPLQWPITRCVQHPWHHGCPGGRHHAKYDLLPMKTKMFFWKSMVARCICYWNSLFFSRTFVSFWGHAERLLNPSMPRALSRGHRRTIRWVGIYQQEPLDVARLRCFFLHGNRGNHRKTTPICYMYGRFTYMNVWIVW